MTMARRSIITCVVWIPLPRVYNRNSHPTSAQRPRPATPCCTQPRERGTLSPRRLHFHSFSSPFQALPCPCSFVFPLCFSPDSLHLFRLHSSRRRPLIPSSLPPPPQTYLQLASVMATPPHAPHVNSDIPMGVFPLSVWERTPGPPAWPTCTHSVRH